MMFAPSVSSLYFYSMGLARSALSRSYIAATSAMAGQQSDEFFMRKAMQEAELEMKIAQKLMSIQQSNDQAVLDIKA